MSQGHHATPSGAAGSVLAAARQEMNLSVVDVARHLKLSPAQVEALEDGAYERLPGRVFVRGFLRNYAKLLGIDPQPLLKSIESQMPEPAMAEERPSLPQMVMPRERPARWPLYTVLVAALIVAALAVYEFGFNEPPPSSPQEGNAADMKPDATTEPAPAPAAAEPQSPSPAAPAAVTPSAPAAGAQQANPQQGGIVTTTAEQPRAIARSGGRELYFKFEQESWVEVRDRNDRVIFSKLNPAGSEERINATPPLKLIVGNARGVRLNYDDQPVNLEPHTGVTVARLTLE
jgi:cytoskeleton protein RodZ